MKEDDPLERMRGTMGRTPYAGREGPGQDVRDDPTIGPEAHPAAERARAEPMPVTPVERPGESDTREITVAAADGPTEVDDYQLGFPAAMALVDNLTNRYCWLDGAGTWCPPGVLNYPMWLRGSRRAKASLRTDRQPPGVTSPARTAGQICVVRYFEKPVSAGSPIFLSGFSDFAAAALLGAVQVQNGTSGTLATVRTPADGLAEVPALVVEADLMGWSGTARQRLKTTDVGVNPPPQLTLPVSLAAVDRISNALRAITSSNTMVDGDDGTGALPVTGWLYNSAARDRARSASAANLGAQSGLGAALVSLPGDRSQAHAPAANVQATTTVAGVAGVRHKCTGITASLVAGALAPAVAIVQAVLRDGASGVGAILWSEQLVLQAVAGDKDNIGPVSGLNKIGTAGNAMTLEFTAAGGANTTEVVSLDTTDAT